MKVSLRNTTFDAFQFMRHTEEALPSWARSYSVKHGADKAKLYRHATQCKVFVPVKGGFIPANPTDWLIHDGEQILVVADTEFKRRYKLVPDLATTYPSDLIYEHVDDDRG